MSVKDAVVDRFLELCHERNIRINELANLSGVTPSTAYSMMDKRPRCIHVGISRSRANKSFSAERLHRHNSTVRNRQPTCSSRKKLWRDQFTHGARERDYRKLLTPKQYARR